MELFTFKERQDTEEEEPASEKVEVKFKGFRDVTEQVENARNKVQGSAQQGPHLPPNYTPQVEKKIKIKAPEGP